MGFSRPWLCSLLLTAGCASSVWNRRVYSCEEVGRIEVEGSVVEILEDEEEADDDCYVQVRGLSDVAVEGGTLVGTGVEVFANRPLPIDVLNSTMAFDAEGLFIDGDRGDYRWLPDEQQLDVTGVGEEDGATVDVQGDVSVVVLTDAGEVTMNVSGGFTSVEGSATSLDFTTRKNFELISVNVREDATLRLPGQAVYDLDLSAGGELTVAEGIRTEQVDPISSVVMDAGNDLTITANSGGSYQFPSRVRSLGVFCYLDEGTVLLEVGTSFEAEYVLFDAVNSEDYKTKTLYESHRIEKGAVPGAPPGAEGYSARLQLGLDTGFSCVEGEDYGEELGDQMTYLVRVYDADGRMLECYSVGEDGDGMRDGTYRQDRSNTYRDEGSITPNACDTSFREDG